MELIDTLAWGSFDNDTVSISVRRTASINMLAAGVLQAVAMKITGHRTDSMFRRYAIVDEAQKREALAKTQQHVEESKSRKVVAIGRG